MQQPETTAADKDQPGNAASVEAGVSASYDAPEMAERLSAELWALAASPLPSTAEQVKQELLSIIRQVVEATEAETQDTQGYGVALEPASTGTGNDDKGASYKAEDKTQLASTEDEKPSSTGSREPQRIPPSLDAQSSISGGHQQPIVPPEIRAGSPTAVTSELTQAVKATSTAVATTSDLVVPPTMPWPSEADYKTFLFQSCGIDEKWYDPNAWAKLVAKYADKWKKLQEQGVARRSPMPHDSAQEGRTSNSRATAEMSPSYPNRISAVFEEDMSSGYPDRLKAAGDELSRSLPRLSQDRLDFVRSENLQSYSTIPTFAPPGSKPVAQTTHPARSTFPGGRPLRNLVAGAVPAPLFSGGRAPPSSRIRGNSAASHTAPKSGGEIFDDENTVCRSGTIDQLGLTMRYPPGTSRSQAAHLTLGPPEANESFDSLQKQRQRTAELYRSLVDERAGSSFMEAPDRQDLFLSGAASRAGVDAEDEQRIARNPARRARRRAEEREVEIARGECVDKPGSTGRPASGLLSPELVREVTQSQSGRSIESQRPLTRSRAAPGTSSWASDRHSSSGMSFERPPPGTPPPFGIPRHPTHVPTPWWGVGPVQSLQSAHPPATPASEATAARIIHVGQWPAARGIQETIKISVSHKSRSTCRPETGRQLTSRRSRRRS